MSLLGVALELLQYLGYHVYRPNEATARERYPGRGEQIPLDARDGTPEDLIPALPVRRNILEQVLDRLADQGLVLVEINQRRGLGLALGVQDDFGVSSPGVVPGDAGVGGAKVYADRRNVLAYGP